jgi:hypothetical protein
MDHDDGMINQDFRHAAQLVQRDMELEAICHQEAARQEAARQEEEWLRNGYPRDGWSSHCYPVYY